MQWEVEEEEEGAEEEGEGERRHHGGLTVRLRHEWLRWQCPEGFSRALGHLAECMLSRPWDTSRHTPEPSQLSTLELTANAARLSKPPG